MYTREFEEKLQGFTQVPASPQKVCDENESRRKKRYTLKNIFDGKFIRFMQKVV